MYFEKTPRCFFYILSSPWRCGHWYCFKITSGDSDICPGLRTKTKGIQKGKKGEYSIWGNKSQGNKARLGNIIYRLQGQLKNISNCHKFKAKLCICYFWEGLIAINWALQLLVNPLSFRNSTVIAFLKEVFPVFSIDLMIESDHFLERFKHAFPWFSSPFRVKVSLLLLWAFSQSLEPFLSCLPLIPCPIPFNVGIL